MCRDCQMLNPNFASFIIETYLHIDYFVPTSTCASIVNVDLHINYQHQFVHQLPMLTCATTINVDLHQYYQHQLAHRLLVSTCASTSNINLQVMHQLLVSTTNVDYQHQLTSKLYCVYVAIELVMLMLTLTNSVNDPCIHIPCCTNHDL
jgi:hypothetical protein